METTLHRQLKEHYASPTAEIEVKLGRYRIDVVDGGVLIEVQHSGLSSIRDKIKDLCSQGHTVEVIKPLIARRRLISLQCKDGQELRRRWSPKRCGPLDMFHELIYFTSAFPHSNLTLRMPLIEIEEYRFPKKRRNRRRGQFKVQDQTLIKVVSEHTYQTHQDLRDLLPKQLPPTFGTLEIAESLEIDRGFAQRIAYCLRKTGTVKQVGKQGNSLQYRFTKQANSKQSKPKKKVTRKATKKVIRKKRKKKVA